MKATIKFMLLFAACLVPTCRNAQAATQKFTRELSPQRNKSVEVGDADLQSASLGCASDLKAIRVTDSIQISWVGAGVLQVSTNLGTGWADVPGAPSGLYTLNPSSAHQFFRVACALGPSLSAGVPGVSLLDPTNLLSAFNVVDSGTVAATDVTITSITSAGATLSSPALPLKVGAVSPGESATVSANFSGRIFNPGATYPITVAGSYLGGNGSNSFTLVVNLTVPPAAGALTSSRVVLTANHVTGAPYPPQPPAFDDEVNPGLAPVPTAPFVDGPTTTNSTVIQKIPGITAASGSPSVIFAANSSLGISGSTVAEPSGASGNGVIFASANSFAAYSTDSGASFSRLDPTTIFPATGVGFCCDQIVQYLPSVDRFIWLLQGNGVRLASASAADIKASGGTAWTFWDFTPGLIGLSSFDYPDLSVGDNYLYMSWNASGAGGGHLVGRTSLAGLAAGGTITVEYYVIAESGEWFAHLMQSTGDGIFWAGHNDNRHMRVYSWPEGSGAFSRDVTLPRSWANNASTLSSTTQDGMDWLTKARNVSFMAPMGATRVGSHVWFAWNAGTDNFFRQPHVEMVRLDSANNFQVVEQVQIWNNSYAFAYPALHTACNGDVGLSLEYGGPNDWENHVVGFWGDFIVYITTGSNTGTTRFGDYVTLRPAPTSAANPAGNLLVAFGYGLTSVPPPGTGTRTDIRYILFGRPPERCIIR